MSLLDFLFPKRCVGCRKFGGYLCSSCFSYISFIETGVCVVCQRGAIGGLTHPICKSSYAIDGVFSSLVYRGVVKKLVYNFKYKPYLTDLKDLLVELFYEGLIQKEAFYKLLTKESFLVPIPLYRTKQKSRGYNQSALLAGGLARKFDINVLECLERIKNTHTQVGFSQAKRQENIKNAFSLKKEYLPKLSQYSDIFLVDDVATSGATLREAAKVLKRNGVKRVWGITLAHGQ